MQKLVRLQEGTRTGWERTRAAVKRGPSFIRTKSFVSSGVFLAGSPPGGHWVGKLSPQQKVGAFSQVVSPCPQPVPQQSGDGGPCCHSPGPWVLRMVVHHGNMITGVCSPCWGPWVHFLSLLDCGGVGRLDHDPVCWFFKAPVTVF